MSPVRLVTDAALAHLRWGRPAAGRPPVLLLHGVGGGRGGWDGSAALLAAAGFELLAVDLPGYGLSPTISPYDLAGMADAVQRLVESLQAGPAIVVGHSMGGMVAQELAARAPQSLAGLVLAGTSPAFGQADGLWQQDFLRERFAPLDAGAGMAGLAAQLVPAMAGPQATAERLADAHMLMAAVPEATYRSALRALLAFDRRADLPRIAVPTLVVTGEHDRTAPPDLARRMAGRIPGARLVTVAGAGHLLPIEAPQAFAAALQPFLEGGWPGRAAGGVASAVARPPAGQPPAAGPPDTASAGAPPSRPTH